MSDTMTQEPEVHIPAWTLGERIRKAREDCGLNQSALGERIGSNAGTITGWETDRHTPSLQMVELIAEETTVPLWWLLGYQANPGRSAILKAKIRNRWFRQLDLGFFTNEGLNRVS